METNTVPVRDGKREIGAYVTGPATYVPAVDVNRIVALTAATISVVAIAVALRRRPAIGAVTMGPGGWVSVKGAALPPLRDGGRRPWWARLLRAHRLVVKE
jgi:hypothetical protein